MDTDNRWWRRGRGGLDGSAGKGHVILPTVKVCKVLALSWGLLVRSCLHCLPWLRFWGTPAPWGESEVLSPRCGERKWSWC